MDDSPRKGVNGHQAASRDHSTEGLKGTCVLVGIQHSSPQNHSLFSEFLDSQDLFVLKLEAECVLIWKGTCHSRAQDFRTLVMPSHPCFAEELEPQVLLVAENLWLVL